MKIVILTFACFILAVHGYGQPGSSCADPKVISVNDSVCVWNLPATGKEFSNNFDTIPLAFYHNRKILPRVKVWYKFNAVSKNLGFRIKESRNYSVIVLSGTCNNFDTLWSNASYLPNNTSFDTDNKEPMFGFGENLIIGNEYYIQVCFTENPVLYREQLCLYRLPDLGQKIISGQGNGNWHERSSWVQNRIPTAIDTVVISDGSNITIAQTSDIAVKSLVIGSTSSSVAKLYIQSWSNNFWIYGDIRIGENDSLIGNPNAGFSDRYRIHGDINLDGIIKFFKKNQVSKFKPVFNLKSFRRQTVDGQGQFLGCGIPGLIIDNPEGVKWKIDGYCRSQIYLKTGYFDNTLCNISFHYDTLLVPYDGSNCSVSLESGILGKKINGIKYYHSLGLNNNSFLFCQVKDNEQEINEDVNIEEYFLAKPSFLNFKISKGSGKKVIFNHSLYAYSIDFRDGGVLKGNDTDTLTFFNNTGLAYSLPNTYAEFGYYRNIYRNSGPSTWQVPAWAGGKARSFAFIDYLANAPAGNVIQVRIKTTPPGGAVVAPATFMMGPHVVEVTSNTALAAATKLRLEVYDTDSLVGLKNSWRIAQAPTPNGPWTPLAVTHTFVADNDPILDAIMTTTNPISLANGNYFAFASVGNPTDAVLSRVIPIPTFGFGCGPGQSTTVKMLVNNNGLTPLTEVMAGALVNGSLYFQNYAVGSNWPAALAVGATDTLRFSIPGDAAINGLVKFFVSASGEGNHSNDTLKIRLNTLPTPLPVTINFDTCKYLRLNVAGLPKYGFPIVAGWENGPIGPENNLNFTYNNTFTTVPTEPLPNSNKVHLLANLYFPFGRGFFRSSNVGPIGNSTWLSYRLNIANDPNIVEIRPTDTLTIEVSNDCGQSYVPLRIINRTNYGPYLSESLYAQPNVVPPSRWWDSIPFPPGSIVHFRFRMKTNQPVSTFGTLHFDDVRFVDTLFTGIRPDLEQANEWQVYPNPASDEVFFTIPKGQQLKSLNLFDALGRRYTLAIPPPNQPASLKGISPGVYILEAQTEGKRYRQRLVVH